MRESPLTFVDTPEFWKHTVPHKNKLWPYLHTRAEPPKAVVLPDVDMAFANTSWALAWTYHRAMTLCAELGVVGLALTYVWVRDQAYAYWPYTPMPAADGDAYWEYMGTHAPWDAGPSYSVEDAIGIARTLGLICNRISC